ncbi:hypothetical protein [Actinoplanes couchii]|uniref:Ferredoxin n=1 Tax=Actinoplanes couchii TaxID=403638 RepID=A0ABQ3XMV6_9ACTN|nr:hypothetical protein [Actinoplanes couchii]MDR6317858.1 hypothetical protein [Actinoplanes couchii]GID59845.1 hypothetical protein Aco03nite_082490 [Actinoplanes couchii]
MNERNEARYWDPIPHLGAVLAATTRPDPDAIFRGQWLERNWRNVPGPIYGAMTDNCWTGRLHAPRHVLYGDDLEYEQEFLYRQPRDVAELRAVVDAVEQDPWAGWACDGDRHWTPGLVREWWRDRGRLRDWITTKHSRWSISERADEREAATGLTDYLAYLDDGLEGDLRLYCYFLDNRVSPTADDHLPSL